MSASSTPTASNIKPSSSKSSTALTCPKENKQTNNDDLNGIPYFSSDELDELFKVQLENASSLQKLKQSVDVSAAEHEPCYVSREKLQTRHPQFANLTFNEIIDQLIVTDNTLPRFDEQVITRETVDKLSSMGHCVEKTADKGIIVTSSREGNVKMYHSGFSARLEPDLADSKLNDRMQEFRKTLDIGLWETGVSAGKKVDPLALAGTTETEEAECEEEEADFIQGTVAAWIVPKTTPISTSTKLSKKNAGKEKSQQQKPTDEIGAVHQRPEISYPRMITMALENSKTGSLHSRDIFKFMCETFPYFATATVPANWKNTVRHTLTRNKRFMKVTNPGTDGGVTAYRYLWTLNPEKISKIDKGVGKASLHNPVAIRKTMSNLENLEKDQLKEDYPIVRDSNDDVKSVSAFLRMPARVEASGSLSNSLEHWEKLELMPLPKVTYRPSCFFPYDFSLPIRAPVQSKNATELGSTLQDGIWIKLGSNC